MLGVYQKLYDTATSILPPSSRGSGDWCFYSDGNSLLHLSICTAPILFWSLGGGGVGGLPKTLRYGHQHSPVALKENQYGFLPLVVIHFFIF